MIYTHGFVPDDFGVGITVPVIKDRLGNITRSSNYRPISLSLVISKVFEYSILHKYEHLFYIYSTLFAVPLNNSHIKTTRNNQIILASVGHVYPTID